MKKTPRKKTPEEKAAEKLAKLLGLTEVLEETVQQKEILQGNLHGVSEDKIKERRDIQAVTYYLVAPDLFTFRACKFCGADFAVSRLQVAYCSYNCIRDSMAEIGLGWTRSENMEVIVRDTYDGNEPLWLSHETMVSLERALKRLLEVAQVQEQSNTPSEPTNSDSELRQSDVPPTSVTSPGPQVVEKSSTPVSTVETSKPLFTSRPTTTSSGKRRITFS